MRNDILGGITTFVAMAYIIVVNPAILKSAGLPVGASTVATIVVAAAGSLLMGLYANRPIAVAPYMGENAFLAFGLAALGITWQQRLGSVFVSGVVFLIITIVGLRGWLAKSISRSLRYSFGTGIGLFLAFIGLTETGIVTAGSGVPVKLGAIRDPRVLLAIGGFIVIMALLRLRVRGAILIGIAVTAGAGILLGYGHAPRALFAMPFTGEYSLAAIALQLDVRGRVDAVVPADPAHAVSQELSRHARHTGGARRSG
jgi:AGZA family xanthine/uracil permease-like MFS transporter